MRKILIICGLMLCFYSSIAQNVATYKNPNDSKKVKVQADTILYQYQYKLILQELYSLKNEKAELEQTVQSLKEQIAKKEETDIDKFLNMQDTTIFGSQFKNISLDSIPQRSRDFYNLIMDIHDLNTLLTGIENMNIFQLRSVGNQLSEAKRLIDEINSFAKDEKHRITDYLSENQKQYFRDLVKRYNVINSSFNRSLQQYQ